MTSWGVYFLLLTPAMGLHYSKNMNTRYPQHYHVQEVERFHSEFRQGGTSPPSPGGINLAQYAGLFKGCLIHLINFQGVDIYPGGDGEDDPLPIVTSRYDVVEIFYQVQSKLHPRNKPFLASQTRILPYEKVASAQLEFCPDYTEYGQCNDLPAIDNTAKVKPWTCEVHLYLHPPKPSLGSRFYEREEDSPHQEFLHIPGSYKRFWTEVLNTTENPMEIWYEPDMKSKSQFSPINRVKYDIFVQDDPVTEGSLPKDGAEAWVNTLSISRGTLISVDFRHIFPFHEMMVMSDEGKELSWLCRSFNTDGGDAQFVSLLPLSPSLAWGPLQEVIAATNLANLDRIHWGTLLHFNMFDALGKAVSELQGVSEYGQFLGFRKGLKEINHYVLNDLRWYSEMKLLLYALKNETLCTQDAFFGLTVQDCIRGLDWRKVPGLFIWPLGKEDPQLHPFHPQRLKFVSYGNSSSVVGLLPAFKNLAGVFQPPIWLGILISILTMSMASGKVRQGYSLTTGGSRDRNSRLRAEWLPCMKMLLEQGDPIAAHNVSSHTAMRLVYASFLLVAVVLSNAFKNENVTQITLPREPIRFDSFSSLLEYGFDIFTRGTFHGSPGLRSLSSTISKLAKFIRPEPSNSTQNDHFITNVWRSELYVYGREEVSSYHYWSWQHPPSSLPQRVQRVMNVTKLHPLWYEIFSGDMGVTEEDVLLSCNKSALLLTDMEAHDLYYKVKGKGLNAFLGDDPGFTFHYGISFFRWVNPFVYQRMDGLYRAGLFKWWTDTLVKFMKGIKLGKLDEGRRPPTASNLQGNISVVFAIYSVGVVISLLVFSTEAKYQINLSLKGLALRLRSCRKVGKTPVNKVEDYQTCDDDEDDSGQHAVTMETTSE